MNAKTQCLRRLGWITAVFALMPGVMLLACGVGEETQRSQESCGNEATCQGAAEQVAFSTVAAVSAAAAQAAGLTVPPFRAPCSQGGGVDVSGEVEGLPPHINYDLDLAFDDCRANDTEDDLVVNGDAVVTSDVDLEGHGDYFLESEALEVSGTASGIPVAFTCPVELTVHFDGESQDYEGTACGLPVSGSLPS